MTRRLQSLVLLALPFLTLAACSACSGGSTEGAKAETPNPEPAPVNVSLQRIEPSSLRDELELSGRLEPWVEVEIATELGGTVSEVAFEKGRYVEKGQVLARIGTDLLQAALEEAEAALAAAEADYSKTKELFDRQAVPRQELVGATSTLKQAEARTKGARLRVERSILEAPVSGIAVSREIEEGEVVAPGSRVTVIHQLSRLKATTGIPENDIVHFRVGGEARLAVDAYPGREFTGKIHFLAPAATGQNRTFPAEIEIDNREGALKPGMIVRVALVRRIFENAVVVPRDAVLERDTGSVVFVRKNGAAELRKVETGPSEGGRIVVLSGLAPGEELIVSGHRNLVDGQNVRDVGSAKGGAEG